MSQTCEFCDKDNFNSQVIFQNDCFFVIHSHRPLAKGHVIIIPKKHRKSFIDLGPKETKSLFSTIKRISNALTKTYNNSGFNLFANVGKSAGQNIPHLHFHLLPRFDQEKISPFSSLTNKQRKGRKIMNRAKLGGEIKKIQSNL